jgi:hypothetical protein
MLPKPAAMAVPPSTTSPMSWNPAVPPPPVIGAAVGGGGVYEGVGDGVAGGVTLAVLVGGEVVGAGVLGLAPALEVLLLVGLLTDGELTLGDKSVGGALVVVVPGPEQAASATQASTVVRPQPMTVSLTRCAVHAMAVRAFIQPPHALGNHHFPVFDRRNRRWKENAWRAFGGHNTGPQHKQPMACSPPEY